MVIRYEAFDGKLFYTKEECNAYERQMNIEMYDRQGRPTENPDAAMIVYLGDFDNPRGDDYIRLCETYQTYCAGIDTEDSGWFFWDECADTYRYIDDDVISAFGVVIAKRKGIK